MFTVCFIYFQRLGRRAEAELSQSLQTVRQQSGIIEEARRTEQLQSQQVIAKMREINTLKSTFVAMTSHEFRTPLATILSSEELLRHYGERLGADERAALFDAIEGAVGRMTDMLDKVLTIGRDDADMLECAPAATDLAALCEALAREARTLFTPGVQVSVQLHLDLAAPLLMLDAKLLRFMVGNLLSNAIKYSPEGGKVELRVRYESGTLQIEVRDQGIGIPAQALPQLFDTFHRATNVGNIAGTGLGLSIVQRAARRHGGSVEVHSTLGQGSCFTITLPGVAVAV
jgi:signal transduction histidine kinase